VPTIDDIRDDNLVDEQWAALKNAEPALHIPQQGQERHYDCTGCRYVDMNTARCSLCIPQSIDRAATGIRRLWTQS